MTLKGDFLHDSSDDDAPPLDGQNPEGLKSAAVRAYGRLSLFLFFKAPTCTEHCAWRVRRGFSVDFSKV